jgi:hypothetical protein
LSIPARFWVARKTTLSLFMASVRALTDLARPTNKGATIKGNTTMSRRGSKGSTSRFGLGSPSLKNFGMFTMRHTTE